MNRGEGAVQQPLLAERDLDQNARPSESEDARSKTSLKFERLQYLAVLRKNFALKTRGNYGKGKPFGLFIEIILPALFFVLMCVPKALYKPQTTDTEFSQAFPLNTGLWSNCYVCGQYKESLDSLLDGTCVLGPHPWNICLSKKQGKTLNLAIAPNTSEIEDVAKLLAKTLACSLPKYSMHLDEFDTYVRDILDGHLPFEIPEIMDDRFLGLLSFSERFLTSDERNSTKLMEECGGDKCYRSEKCWGMFAKKISLYSSEDEIIQQVGLERRRVLKLFRMFALLESEQRTVMCYTWEQVKHEPMSVTAALIFNSDLKSTPDGNVAENGLDITIRMNQTDVPDAEIKYSLFQVSPDMTWKCGSDMYPNGTYWFFGNLESAVFTSVLSWLKKSEMPMLVDTWVSTFPWPKITEDDGAAIAGVLLVLLLVFAFIAPFKSAVGNIVTEKELRLREGMKLFGLQTSTYYLSWFTTHFSTLFLSVILITAVGSYPFSYSSTWIMFIFYLIASIAFIAYAYAVASLFSSSKIAGPVSVFIFVLTLVPGYIMPIVQPYGGRGRIISCLLPPSAVTNWAMILLQLESGEVGIKWDTLRTGVTEEYPFTAQQCIQMLLLDIVIYFFLAWYLDQVLPSTYGQRKPFYFIFLPQTYGISFSSTSHSGGDKRPLLEENMEDSSPGGHATAISIKNLCKNFGTPVGIKKAVRNLNLNIEDGSITTLLGHNGAGKTTTLSIVTGMMEATSGDVDIRGKSVKREMRDIRQDLGLCPQYDILWPQLTVYEHLRLYADLKGMRVDRPELGRHALSAEEIDSEIRTVLIDVGLENKIDERAGALSGGQKRKLSVAIAFLGGPRTVFLDEPTSGMDPYSRRFTWNVIRKYKAGRCILLTTHFMDEADILSDKIAIMSQGRLGAYGSPLELKQQYGMGYTLTVLRNQDGAEHDLPQVRNKTDEQFSQEIVELTKSHVPDAVVSSLVGSEVSMKLPKDRVSSFPALLQELELNGKEKYDVGGYGLSITTIEEVFLNLLKEDYREDENTKDEETIEDSNDDLDDDSNVVEGVPLIQMDSYNSGTRMHAGIHAGMQFMALLNKRFINSKRLRNYGMSITLVYCLLFQFHKRRTIAWHRDKLAFLIQLLAPISFVILALAVGKLTSNRINPKSLSLTRENDMRGHDSAYAESPGSTCDFQDEFPPSTYDKKIPDADRIFALDWEKMIIEKNISCLGCVPELWNIYSIASLGSKKSLDKGKCPKECYSDNMLEYKLLDQWADNYIQYDALFLQSLQEPPLNFSDVTDYLKPQLVPQYSFTILVNQTAHHSFPVSIKESAQAIFTKELELEDTFEINVKNHPYPILHTEQSYKDAQNRGEFLLTVCMAMAVAVFSASFSLFLVKERASSSKHVQLVSGVGIVEFWSATFVYDLLNSIIPIGGILICFVAFNLPQYLNENFVAVVLLFVGFVTSSLPLTYLLQFRFKDELKAFTRLLIGYFLAAFLLSSTNLMLEILKGPPANVAGAGAVDSVFEWLFRLIPHYIICKGLSDLDSNYQKGQLGLDLVGYGPKEPLALSVTGYHIIFLIGETILFSLAVIAVEYNWFSRSISSGNTPINFVESDDLDEDVLREKKALLRADESVGYVTVKGLQKIYQGALKPAVKGVYFAVQPKQVFGLLGVNGAGKTTTFNMLTGHVTPSVGKASIMGHSVISQLQAARRHLGYCPQFDATIYNMTGREHLRFYAQLRGIRNIKGSREKLVNSLLKRLGLTEYADRLAGTYSGGNRRKLSVGIALIGDPDVVLLDEPSTGMDPQARRSMWNVISKIVMEKRRAVVLTSHSMEECEALCHRIAIMVDGQFRCIGSNQHLKNRFGMGYNLEFRCKTGDDVEKVKQYAEKELNVQLAEMSGRYIKYRFGHNEETQDTRLSEIFDSVENNRNSLGIEDYGISQTSLEQVFVRFASEQENVHHESIAIHSTS